MKNILKHIPGFRSETTWKKIVASMYYAVSILSGFIEFGMFLFMIGFFVLMCSIADLITRKRKSISARQPILMLIIAFVLIFTGFSLPAGTQDDPGDGIKQEVGTADAGATESEKDAEDTKTEIGLTDIEKGLLEKAYEDFTESEKETFALILGKFPKLSKNMQDKHKADIERLKTERDEFQQQDKIAEEKSTEAEDSLKVHYIDVGQGDCALVHTGSSAMLIDAGNKKDGPSIVGYIKNQGIKKLDYFILTHPHADHIGGAANVVNNIDIDKILMPKATHTSKTFEDLLNIIKSKGLKITSPAPGDNYALGSANFKILASNDGNTLNNNSIVNRLVFENTSFMFAGDAESATESLVLQRGYSIKSDVLKVGHHGSGTSTTESFLKAVSPKHAVISVGKGNSYGHPDQATLNKLSAGSVEIFRTDESGTIIATSDGNTISFNKNPSQGTAGMKKTDETVKKEESSELRYIGNKNSKIFHKSTCSSLPIEKNRIYFESIEEAKNKGYRPCKRCNP